MLNDKQKEKRLQDCVTKREALIKHAWNGLKECTVSNLQEFALAAAFRDCQDALVSPEEAAQALQDYIKQRSK